MFTKDCGGISWRSNAKVPPNPGAFVCFQDSFWLPRHNGICQPKPFNQDRFVNHRRNDNHRTDLLSKPRFVRATTARTILTATLSRKSLKSNVVALLSLLTAGWSKSFTPPAGATMEPICSISSPAEKADPHISCEDGSVRLRARRRAFENGEAQADPRRLAVASAPATADAPLWNGR